jgi:hypothetical protein
MDDDRSAQIFVTNGGSGSGYAITPECILTARHVVHDGTTASNTTEVRLWGDLKEGERAWKQAHVLWSHPILDIALLGIPETERDKSITLRRLSEQRDSWMILARLPSSGQYETEAFGWPRVTRKGQDHQPMPFRGRTTARGQTVGAPLFSLSEDLTPTVEDGWKGMSGAALCIDGVVVGVVTGVAMKFRGKVLEVQALSDIEPDSGFWQYVGVPELPPLEDAVLRRSGIVADLNIYYKFLEEQPNRFDGAAEYFLNRRRTELYIEPDVLKRSKLPDEKPDNELDKEGDESGLREQLRRIFASAEELGPESLEIDETNVYGERFQEMQERIPWQRELYQLDSVARASIIVGPPGQGKTLLAEMTVRSLAAKGRRALEAGGKIATATLPIVVRLSDLVREDIPTNASPTDVFRFRLSAVVRSMGDFVGANAVRVGRLEGYVAAHVHESRTWLFLDALDEVQADLAQLRRLWDVLNQWQCRVFITSRPDGYKSATFPFDIVEYRLAPLTPRQSSAFVRRWFQDKRDQQRMVASLLPRTTTIRAMATNAFLLTLLCAVAEHFGPLPEDLTKAELYERALWVLFGSRSRAMDWRPFLGSIALKRFIGNSNASEIDGDYLRHELRVNSVRPTVVNGSGALSEMEKMAARLDELVRSRRVVARIVREAHDSFVFPHRSILEYLASCELSEQLSHESSASMVMWTRLDQKAWDPRWTHIILFAAGVLGKRVTEQSGQAKTICRLLEVLASSDDAMHSRILLAANCLGEVPLTVSRLLSTAPEIASRAFTVVWGAAFSCVCSTPERERLPRQFLEAWHSLIHYEGRIGRRSLAAILASEICPQFDMLSRHVGCVLLANADREIANAQELGPIVEREVSRNEGSLHRLDARYRLMLAQYLSLSESMPQRTFAVRTLYDAVDAKADGKDMGDQRRQLGITLTLPRIWHRIIEDPVAALELWSLHRTHQDRDRTREFAIVGALLSDDDLSELMRLPNEADRDYYTFEFGPHPPPETLFRQGTSLHLKKEWYGSVMLRVVQGIGPSATENPDTISFILRWLDSESRDGTSEQAAKALAMLGRAAASDPQVVQALRAVLANGNLHLFRQAVDGLGLDAADHPDLVRVLIARALASSGHRHEVARALACFGAGILDVPQINEIISTNFDEQSNELGPDLVRALGALCALRPTVIVRLAERLSAPSTAGEAALLLSAIGPSCSKSAAVADALVSVIQANTIFTRTWEHVPSPGERCLEAMREIKLNLAEHPALLTRVIDLSRDDRKFGLGVTARALAAFEAASAQAWLDPRVVDVFVGYLQDQSNAGGLSKVVLKVLKAAGEAAGRSPQIVDAVLDIVQRWKNRLEYDQDLRTVALETVAAFGPDAGRTHRAVRLIVARCQPRGLMARRRLPPENAINAIAALIGTGKPDRAVKEFAENPPYFHSAARMIPVYEATLRAGYRLIRQRGVMASLIKMLMQKEQVLEMVSIDRLSAASENNDR